MYKIRTLFGSLTYNNCSSLYSIFGRLRTSTFATKSEGLNDEPIKYSQSSASKYKAIYSRIGEGEPRLWYEPYVIMVSLSVFLLYFTVIREENDIDQELSKSLYSRIDGLEELQLQLSLDYNREHGLETEPIIKRLEQIEKLKNK